MTLTFRTLSAIGLLVMLLTFPHWTFAQDQPEDLHKYFDEAGYRPCKNLISTNFLSTTGGLLTLRYERLIVKHFSLEVGVAKVMPYYLFEFVTIMDDWVPYFEPKNGAEVSIAPKYYFQDDGLSMFYVGLRYGRRNYTMEDRSTMQFRDFTAGFGLNGHLTDHLGLGISLGAGARRIHGNHGFRGPGNVLNTTAPLGLAAISLGILF